jgi:gliding motility-associated-like protein
LKTNKHISIFFNIFFVLFFIVSSNIAYAQTCSSPSLVSMSVTTQNLRCNGDNSGSISVSITGGSSPSYTYSLYSVVLDPIIINNYPINNYTFSSLPADNNYLLVIQVPIGGGAFAFCSQSITLTQPPPLSISSGSITNTTCNGGNDGAINVIVSGGPTGPYTYSWNNGATTKDISGLIAGNYTLTITDGNNCSLSKTFTVTEPNPISATSIISNVSCLGGSDGAIDLSISGGTTPYFSTIWSNGATTEDISGLTAGSYSIKITDANNCTKTLNYTITQPLADITVTNTTTNVACNGTSTGAINITPTGGTAPYTFAWTNGVTTQNNINIPAGNYSVTITDSKGCAKTFGPFTITQSPTLAITAPPTITNVTCNGGSTGAITINPTGGTAPYTYSWTNGSTSQNITALVAGNYSVTITDASSCSKTFGPYTINEPAPITATSSITNVSCNGTNTGAINITPSGGTPTYTYLWSNGTTSQNISSLIAGSYTVTITDKNVCSKVLGPFVISQPVPITATGTITNVSCNAGTTGAITLSTPSGGTAPYTYSWSNGANSKDLTAVAAGNYTVTIKDFNGCSSTLPAFTITEPTIITTTNTITNVACNGTSTGAINITPTGGTAPYTFAWTNGVTTQNNINIPAGNYSVTITDSKGCAKTFGPFTITQSPTLAITAPPTITNVTCNGGSTGAITINPTGGTAPYTYSWTNGSTSQNITALVAGNYSVTITDASSCSKTFGPYTINEPAPITATSSITNVSCNGTNTGAINITPSGGTPTYTYLWSNGTTSQNISSLIAGSYTVTITDKNVCSKVLGPFVISQPVPITATGTITNVSCNAGTTGAITLSTPSGGTAPYTYSWSNGANSKDLTAVAAGNYTVTIKDFNGCSSTLPAFTITEPTPISSIGAKTDVVCNGTSTGAINITSATGGVGPYTYSWSNGITTQNNINIPAGNYTVTITDASSCTLKMSFVISEPSPIVSTASTSNVTCNGAMDGSITITNPIGGTAPYSYVWNNGATTQNLPNVIAGNYSLIITDSKGCTKSIGPITISEPASISSSGTTTDPTCNGSSSGSIVLNTPIGGTLPYTYAWSNGATTQNLTNVIAGTYTVIITDKKGCSNPVPISFTLNNGTSIIGTATASPANLCSGASTTITASINPSYTPAPSPYSFNGGVTFQNSATFSIAHIVGDTTVTVVVKDINGCLSNPILVAITTNKIAGGLSISKAISCFGSNDGELTMNITGSSVGYLYSINGSAFQSSNVFSNLSKGTYTVVIDDGKVCKSSYTITLTEPSLLTIGIKKIIDNNPCLATNNGSILVTTNGGNTGKQFTITPSGVSQTDSLFTNLAGNTYTIVVTDSKGCSANVNATINQPKPISISSMNTPISCTNPLSGAIDVSVTGGVTPFTYLWNNGSTNQDLMNLTAGTYKVVVTDSKNCKDSLTVIINPAPTVIGTATASPAIVCSGQSTVITAVIDPSFTAAANAYSFNGGLTYQSSSSFPIASIQADTTVTIIIKDVNGCISNPIVVTIKTSKINASVDVSKKISCVGATDGALTVTVSGPSTGFTYALNGGTPQTSPLFSNLSKGSYTLVIDDGSACKSSYTSILVDPAPLTIGIKSITNVSPCAGGNNGSIAVTANGGSPIYSFTLTPGGTSQSDSTFTNLIVANYSIVVTDAKGCSATTVASILQPTGIDTSLIKPIIVNNKCAGKNEGSITLTNVTGGISPYTFTLNGIINSDATPLFTNLFSGKDTIVITDNKGCNTNYVFTIHEPLPLLYATIITPSSCTSSDGSIKIFNITGGTAPYQSKIQESASYTNIFMYTNLAANSYSVKVKDMNGCITGYDITLDTKPAPVPYVRITKPTCNKGTNGFIVVDSVSGGIPLFQYTFNDIPVGSSTVYSNLSAGDYSLAIADKACTYNIDSFYVYNAKTMVYDTLSSTRLTVKDPNPITASVISVKADRYQNTGVAGIYNIVGGTPGYLWSSDNSVFTKVSKDTVYLNHLHRGNHTIYVVDTNGCKATFNIIIEVEFFIPNLITPNNDGKNDRFEIMALPVGSELLIVNKWGNRVYLSSNYDNSWDADQDTDGVYYYELTLPNGQKYKGWIDVMR